ncbi:MAG: cyclopropane-fatty-acyl-phospholipid synthase family protein [Bradymonadaceae bacterium]
MTGDNDWHEQDDLWRVFRRAVYPEAILDLAPDEVEGVVELAGLEPGDCVLDMPCGIGRHAVELAERGFDVTGVDRTRAYLDVARERAAERGVDVEWVRDDMREFARQGMFDVGINLYTSLGYFDRREENLAVLENIRLSLADGGALVVDLAGKELLAADYQAKTWEKLDDGLYRLSERWPAEGWEWMENRWILVRDDGPNREFRLRHRLYSAVELRELIRDAGFESVEIYGDWEGGEYGPEAERLIAVARS